MIRPHHSIVCGTAPDLGCGDDLSLLLTASTAELDQLVTERYRALAFATERSTTYPYLGLTFVRMVPEAESSSF